MKFKKLFFSLFMAIQLNAQSGIQPTANPKVSLSYNFVQTVGVYEEINGGIVLGNASSTNQSYIDPAVLVGESENLIPGPGFSLGFDFIFNGNTFDRVAVNTNGWLSFGKSSLGNNAVFSQIATAPISQLADAEGNGVHDMSPNNELRNRVSGLGTDLSPLADSDLRIETIGVAPNRVFVAQWRKFKRFGSSSIDMAHTYNFQIRLHETTNIVEVVYGDMVFGPTGYGSQIGLSGYDQTDYNNRWVSSSASSTNSWANTDAGFSPTTSCHLIGTIPPPVSGSTFRWTPTTMGIPNKNFTRLKLFPTIVENTLFVVNDAEIDKIVIYDILGNKVFDDPINSVEFSVDFSRFSSGTYLVNLFSEHQTKAVKIIKK